MPWVKDKFDGMKNWDDEHMLEGPPSARKQEEAKNNENYGAFIHSKSLDQLINNK